MYPLDHCVVCDNAIAEFGRRGDWQSLCKDCNSAFETALTELYNKYADLDIRYTKKEQKQLDVLERMVYRKVESDRLRSEYIQECERRRNKLLLKYGKNEN